MYVFGLNLINKYFLFFLLHDSTFPCTCFEASLSTTQTARQTYLATILMSNNLKKTFRYNFLKNTG